jgi:hypothetical protein
LFDDDSTVQRNAQLRVQRLRVERGPMLENGDRGDVGQTLG